MANGQDALHCYASGAPHLPKPAAAPATWLNVPCVPTKTWPAAPDASPSVFEARLIIPQTAISAPFPSPTASTFVQGSQSCNPHHHHQTAAVAQPVTTVPTPYVSEYRTVQNSTDGRGFAATTFLRVISAPGMQSSGAPEYRSEALEQNCRLKSSSSSLPALNTVSRHSDGGAGGPVSGAGGMPWPTDHPSAASVPAETNGGGTGSNNIMRVNTSRYAENDVHGARRDSGHSSCGVLYPAESHSATTGLSDGRKQVQFVNYSTLLSPNSVLETGNVRESDMSTHSGSRSHDLSSPRHSHHSNGHHAVAHQDRGYHQSSSGYHAISGYASDAGNAGDARLLPVRVRRVKTKVLRQWMIDNKNHPYPSREEKEYLASQCNMTVVQVSTWFANSRRRIQRIGLQGWVNDQVREDDKLHKDKQPSWS